MQSEPQGAVGGGGSKDTNRALEHFESHFKPLGVSEAAGRAGDAGRAEERWFAQFMFNIHYNKTVPSMLSVPGTQS